MTLHLYFFLLPTACLDADEDEDGDEDVQNGQRDVQLCVLCSSEKG